MRGMWESSQSTHSNVEGSVLITYGIVTDYPACDGLKQQEVLSDNFWGPRSPGAASPGPLPRDLS